MKTIKVSEATGPALDWLVAKCEGTDASYLKWWRVGGDKRLVHCEIMGIPSTDWSQGGPIIDKMDGLLLKNWLDSEPNSKCEARLNNYEGDFVAFGPTPLIAAMRCYVISKLGEIVEIPEELTLETYGR